MISKIEVIDELLFHVRPPVQAPAVYTDAERAEIMQIYEYVESNIYSVAHRVLVDDPTTGVLEIHVHCFSKCDTEIVIDTLEAIFEHSS